MAERSTPQSEASLRAAEQAAFAQVYTQHHGWVFGYLRARLLDSNDADDLCQEVFMRAFAGRGRFDKTADIRPWLLGISRNVLREHIRKNQRRKEVAWTELCLELEEMIGQDGQYEDVLATLPLCMSNLGESAGQALRWHYFAGNKIEEIAQRLGRTLGAVKVLMVRARQSLKRCFQERLHRKLP
jgi:RNA polymerase sigma-70 factor, ECF subfamily